MSDLIGKRVIVRDHMAGTYFATLAAFDPVAKTATLTDARKLHQWYAAGPDGLAAKGTRYDRSRVCPAVARVEVCSVVQVLECTEAAAAQLSAAPVWEP